MNEKKYAGLDFIYFFAIEWIVLKVLQTRMEAGLVLVFERIG